MVADFIDGEVSICPHDFLHEFARVFNAHSIRTESADAYPAEFAVTNHHRVARSPFQIGELLGVEKIDFGFKRAAETVIPVLQSGQQRQVLGFQHVHAGREYVGYLTFIDENRDLRLTHGEFCAVFDFVAVALETVNHGVAAAVSPFDDINKLTHQFVP